MLRRRMYWAAPSLRSRRWMIVPLLSRCRRKRAGVVWLCETDCVGLNFAIEIARNCSDCWKVQSHSPYLISSWLPVAHDTIRTAPSLHTLSRTIRDLYTELRARPHCVYSRHSLQICHLAHRSARSAHRLRVLWLPGIQSTHINPSRCYCCDGQSLRSHTTRRTPLSDSLVPISFCHHSAKLQQTSISRAIT